MRMRQVLRVLEMSCGHIIVDIVRRMTGLQSQYEGGGGVEYRGRCHIIRSRSAGLNMRKRGGGAKVRRWRSCVVVRGWGRTEVGEWTGIDRTRTVGCSCWSEESWDWSWRGMVGQLLDNWSNNRGLMNHRS